MTNMKISVASLIRAALLALLLISAPAFALDLGQAKSQGLVGETASGYLGVVSGGGDVQQLVNSVNAQRRAEYQSIAQRNGTSLQAVEALAGKKAIERTPPGQYVQLPSGQWVRK
jgi:uncharacterized protein YdbL (DUF1318 family)